MRSRPRAIAWPPARHTVTSRPPFFGCPRRAYFEGAGVTDTVVLADGGDGRVGSASTGAR
jgi:hypothetical protein